ncbi:S1 RNA-binding domain-containing protein [Ammoniphilus resinae]|uniref:General stress protein 13/S1 RNA binding domain protein n=1 Tax=Ammoniphilus resinae TaxID=861532 RepID=A0ABS4GK21_9BACL|nr:S1 RNA-binding domain-containing protein [Ammoniphilus resinae]MBP1930611.1 general stress protein 13/S1 RNA binding domain protein [Ammoniphilus resinae]
MAKDITIGEILEGKVTAIKEYGAFVGLVSNRSGLVHISQIASEYVKQVEDYLSVGDTVQVKVIDISDDGKISLSIKQVAPLQRKDGKTPDPSPRKRSTDFSRGPSIQGKKQPEDKMNSLEEKLKKWLKTSEERIQDLQSKQKRK